MSVSGALWSRQQREWLQALGHPPLMLVDHQAFVSASLPEPQLPVEPAQPATASAEREARPSVPVRPDEDRLQPALLRATGLPAAEADRALQTLGVDASALRGDPAAKRALWSRLRRLRGGRSA